MMRLDGFIGIHHFDQFLQFFVIKIQRSRLFLMGKTLKILEFIECDWGSSMDSSWKLKSSSELVF